MLKIKLDGMFEETISYMDQNEYYYHGMVAGLLTGMKGFSIRFNRERAERNAVIYCETNM